MYKDEEISKPTDRDRICLLSLLRYTIIQFHNYHQYLSAPHQQLTMHYLTFLGAALALAAGASAGSFTLVQKNNDIRAGCDLKIENVCGCSVTLSVHQTLMCDKLPKVWTHGQACGGKWQLNAENPKHTVQFQTKDCHWGCNLPTLSALDPDDPVSSSPAY